jgi:hypothetical protein
MIKKLKSHRRIDLLNLKLMSKQKIKDNSVEMMKNYLN